MKMATIVSAKGIRMAFGGVEVVKGVGLDLNGGEVHAIIGENGAGKSTLAKIVAGVHRPTAGTLEVEGASVSFDGPRQAIERGIALIHQEPLTFPDLDVAENIFAGHAPTTGPLRRVNWRAMHAKAQEILDRLRVRLSSHDRVGGLSVADQQFVELAAALSREAKVLLMDETTAALTPKEVAELFAIVRRLRDEGVALAFVTHHLDEVFEIADRITVMRDGEKVAELRPSETRVSEVVRLMVGREVAARPIRSSPTVGGMPALAVRGLTVDGRFRDVSFQVRPGEIVGLAGLVGAGRTDVCRAIFGVTRPTAGSIEVAGNEVRIANPAQAMEHGIALVPEDRQHEGLLMPMTIAENGSLAALRTLSRFGWRQEAAADETVGSYLSQLHTAYRSVGQPVRELSGGNQQKVVLAKWLITKPKILILDEPTRGVDVGAKAEIHALIESLVAEGLAILIVSSDLPELLDLCDRVHVMREGLLVAEFDRAAATPEAVMLAATGQESHAV